MSQFLLFPNAPLDRPAPFHIEHRTRPEIVYDFLRFGEATPSKRNITLRSWSKIKPFLKQLGLMTPDNTVSPFGRTLLALARDEHDVTEVMRLWLAVAARVHPFYRFSYAFQCICEILSVEHETDNNDEMINAVREQCRRRYDLPMVAFSLNSLRGALRWLQGTDEPLLRYTSAKKMRFVPRTRCRSIAVLFALDYLLRNMPEKSVTLSAGDSEQLRELIFVSSTQSALSGLRECLRLHPQYIMQTGDCVRLMEPENM